MFRRVNHKYMPTNVLYFNRKKYVKFIVPLFLSTNVMNLNTILVLTEPHRFIQIRRKNSTGK